MKLDSYEMQQAFIVRDWNAAIKIIERVFGFIAPENAKAAAEVYTGAAYDYAIEVVVKIGSERDRYAWNQYEGFSYVRVPAFIASAVYHNVPGIRIWQKSSEAT